MLHVLSPIEDQPPISQQELYTAPPLQLPSKVKFEVKS